MIFMTYYNVKSILLVAYKKLIYSRYDCKVKIVLFRSFSKMARKLTFDYFLQMKHLGVIEG